MEDFGMELDILIDYALEDTLSVDEVIEVLKMKLDELQKEKENEKAV